MSLPNKILMRKIRKLEEHKQKLIKEKAKANQDEKTEKSLKRPADEETAPVQKKRKQDQVENFDDEEIPASNSEILSTQTFDSLKEKVSEKTLKAIAELGFSKMTEIQAKSIPPLLNGRNLVGAAKTGSGKTLAFLIPAVQFVVRVGYKPRNGTGALILTPTRELCIQTFSVLKQLMKYHHQTYGMIIGGADRKAEAKKLSKGVNILVATPLRLLDHMQNTPYFNFRNVMCLVIDEADRIMDAGFEEQMKQIISLLPTYRQTMLFSATQTKKSEALTALVMKKVSVYVGIDDDKSESTVSGLEQGVIFCPTEKRLLFLHKFLKDNKKKKVMVFFSSRASAQYHRDLLCYLDIPCMFIHGGLKQEQRTSTFLRFSRASSGTLLCTDVAARGLDIPAVDWIIQYDPPVSSQEYIHRVGRTARGEGSTGKAVLILRKEEYYFLRYLTRAKVPLNEYEYDWSRVPPGTQAQLEEWVGENIHLRGSAKDAFRAYLKSYSSHQLKNVFDINTLDLKKLASSFGLKFVPPLDAGPGEDTNNYHKKKGKRRFNESGKPNNYKSAYNSNKSDGHNKFNSNSSNLSNQGMYYRDFKGKGNSY